MRTRSLGIVLGLTMVGTALVGGPGNFASAEPTPDPCFDKTPTLIATDGVTRGSSKADVIYVPSGVEGKVYGNGGNDFICSDSYYVVISAGAGNDMIDGFGEIHGDAGNDTITSEGFIVERSSVVVYGGAGNDDINVDDAYFVDGGSGNDYIHADESDEVRGGSGNDEMHVHDSNQAFGDGGDDLVQLRDTDSVDCGSGRDVYAHEEDDTAMSRRCEIEDIYED